jgi:hypothetical protein
MSEQTNALPRHLRQAPSFVTEPIVTNEPGVAADMQRVEQDIKEAFKRAAPAPATGNKETKTPLQRIAADIKLLVHDHGEDFGEKLEKQKGTDVTMAKALQLWADA